MVNERSLLKPPKDGSLKMSLLQQKLIGEYEKQMKQRCSQRHMLRQEEFQDIHEDCRAVAVTEFMADPDSDMFTTVTFKQALQLKYLELKQQNEEKPTVESIAGGAIAGSVTGVGVAAGGAVGTVAVSGALALSAVVSTGGLVLVGVTAVGIGVGIGFGVQKLVSVIQNKNKKTTENEKQVNNKSQKSNESKINSEFQFGNSQCS